MKGIKNKGKKDLKSLTRKDGKPYRLKIDKNRFFYPDEYMKTEDFLKKNSRHTAICLINTGARINEARNIKKNDIAEIISGPFKREKCKITRIDKAKEEVVVELLEAAVPIPITVKMDAVKVIRRDEDKEE